MLEKVVILMNPLVNSPLFPLLNYYQCFFDMRSTLTKEELSDMNECP